MSTTTYTIKPDKAGNTHLTIRRGNEPAWCIVAPTLEEAYERARLVLACENRDPCA